MKESISTYSKENLTHIGFPLGGIGAGMFCLEGTGSLGKFSIRNEADVHFEPNIFSALCIKKDGGNIAKVIEGQVPYYKIFGGKGDNYSGAGNGLSGKNYGLPRFRDNQFSSRFPFAYIDFEDSSVPLKVSLTGYSPFTPTDPDNSSLPVASLTYTFHNSTNEYINAVYYISSFNFMNVKTFRVPEEIKNRARVYRKNDGFILNQPAWENEPHIQGDFYVAVDDKNAKVNTDWFQGGWFDILTMQWNDIKAGNQKDGHHPDSLSPGGSVSVDFTLAPNERKEITVKFAWYVPETNIRVGAEIENSNQECCEDDSSCCCTKEESRTYKPFYTSIFSTVEDVMAYFTKKYDELYNMSKKFSDAIYNMTLPDAVMDAVTANLSILKSPTVLRQPDGKLWAWEGCFDFGGCCHGTCTHVWNYAQAICHLFPSLERSLRHTEFNASQNAQGHQNFRASLPVREPDHGYHAASDGQLGGIMKMYREWKIYGDEKWLRSYYNKMHDSIEYCIHTWDKKEEGVLKEPHHNTYDIEFWGADGMCTSFYLGALKAFAEISEALSKDAERYKALYKKGREYMENKLFNGEYFIQEAEWLTLEAKFDASSPNPQVTALLEKEGPKYQYKNGCISDGVLGAWLAKMCGLGEILDVEKVKSHLLAVYKYNYRKSLIEHDNPQRPGYAVGNEGGLLLCSWPHDDKPSLPFVYSDEVWTGIEYQVASHLISFGYIKEGIDIVETCRSRYDGTKRNPYNEYECGHWYARAMASYGLIQAFSGVRYDADKKVIYISGKPENGFKSFLCTDTGYGTVIFKDGKAEIDVVYGNIKVNDVVFE